MFEYGGGLFVECRMLGLLDGLNIEWMDGGPGIKVELSIAVVVMVVESVCHSQSLSISLDGRRMRDAPCAPCSLQRWNVLIIAVEDDGHWHHMRRPRRRLRQMEEEREEEEGTHNTSLSLWDL